LVSTPQRLVNLAEGKLPGGDAVLESLRELVGLVVIDEAHRAAAPMYRKLMGVFGGGPEGPGIIGLTATPFRHSTDAARPESGMLELRELFGTILEPVETLGEEPRQTLQRRGFLAQPVFTSLPTRTRLRPPEGVNTEDPNDEDTERIDFALKMRADQPDRRLIALEHMVGLCPSPEALVLYFGPTVPDAECMAFLLRQRGITAAFVSGDTREVTRRKIIQDFRSGRTQVLCNCEVLTTGFDAPRVTHVVMARPTVSQVLYEQMVGRGLRGPAFGGTETGQVIDMEDQYRAGRPELGYKRFRALWGAG
jgi:DNA repair protein RadD